MSPAPVEAGINIKSAVANKADEFVKSQNIDGFVKSSGCEASQC